MEDDIFCKIVRREIPAQVVYEDEHTLAFLDIAPNSKGHTLVIPKKHARNIFDIDQETLAQTMEAVHKVAPAVKSAVNARGVHITSNHEAEAGQVVFHLHFHIIPRHARSEFEFWPKIDISSDEQERIAEAIRKEVSAER